LAERLFPCDFDRRDFFASAKGIAAGAKIDVDS
jgi:hypothetical protein